MKAPNHTGIVNLLLEQKIISLEPSPVKGTSIKAPVGVFLQNMFNERKTLQAIAMAILAEIPREVVSIAGIGFDGIPLALNVAGYSHRRFIPVQSDYNANIEGFQEKNPLKGEKVMLITGVITTGEDCGDAVRLINKAGGECLGISCLFDFGLRPRYPLKEIYPLVTMEQLSEGYLGAYSRDIKAWLIHNKSMLRKQEAELLV